MTIRGAGICQLDKNYFIRSDGTTTPGYRDLARQRGNRRPVRAHRQDGSGAGTRSCSSDKTFLQDYNPHLSRYRVTDPFQTGASEGVSQLYLAGKGNRSYFDARSIYFYGFSEADVQKQIPVIHPVIDYNYTFDHPIIGGELGYNVNFTSLTRSQANFDADHPERVRHRQLLANRRPRGQDHGQLPAARHPRHLQPLLGRNALAAQHHRLLRPGVHAVRIAARRRRGDARRQRSGRVELHRAPATPMWCAPCRRSASNTAIPSSTCSPGARRRSSRSRR